MTSELQLAPKEHRKQIEAYRKEEAGYRIYAATLKRVLEEACWVSFPEAFVQSRPKSMSSFAEKVARKFDTYPNAVRVAAILEPYATSQGANRCELLLDLGYSLCRLHRGAPGSAEYARGRRYLEESLELCECREVRFVPHLRKCRTLHARALTRLAWALQVIRGKEHQACEYYHLAHEYEPANPYYLANMLGFEMFCARDTDLPATMRTTLREGIRACRNHALAGIGLPDAYFTAGRLSMLLGAHDAALGYYARGTAHCLAETAVPCSGPTAPGRIPQHESPIPH